MVVPVFITYHIAGYFRRIHAPVAFSYFYSSGESCATPKKDSLTLLKDTLTAKKIGYVCKDVIGDPNSTSSAEIKDNAKDVANVIKTYQTQARKCVMACL